MAVLALPGLFAPPLLAGENLRPAGQDGQGRTSAPAIEAAAYEAPTRRYAHGVLGDDIEYGALALRLADGSTRRFLLPEDRVFEDLAPRLADLDGDGAPEVITVETQKDLGAQLAIYSTEGKIAATPHIGSANRWLAPVGAADLDGDGRVEIAYVDRPHLAKVLRIWRFRDGRLEFAAELDGFTNHRIGEDSIAGGIRDCGAGPEMVLATADWSRVVALGWDGENFLRRDLFAHRGRESFARAMACGS